MAERLIRDWTLSESVDILSADAEVFFTRLIMKADDFGNYLGTSKILRASLYPLKPSMKESKIERMIGECKSAGVIIPYEVEGKRYLNIPNYGQRMRTLKGRYPSFDGKVPVNTSIKHTDADILPTDVSTTRTSAWKEEKGIGMEEKEIAHDFEFKSSFAQIFNKPYPKERGLDGAGRDVDTIIAQLAHIPKEEIIKTAKAMKAVYQSQKLHLPTNVATLINSFTGTDWVERLKELDPEQVAENISKERKNGKQRTPEPDTIGTSAPGSLG